MQMKSEIASKEADYPTMTSTVLRISTRPSISTKLTEILNSMKKVNLITIRIYLCKFHRIWQTKDRCTVLI